MDQQVLIDEVKIHARRILVNKLWIKKRTTPEILDKVQKEFPGTTLDNIIDDVKFNRKEFKSKAEGDKKYLDRKLEHVFGRLNELDTVQAELWTQLDAIPADMYSTRIKCLDAIQKVSIEKAKLQQLISHQTEITHKIQLAKESQTLLIKIVREVTADCPRCRELLQERLSGIDRKRIHADAEDGKFRDATG